jgi:hypothetical protein
MQTAVHSRRAFKSRGRLHQISQLLAVGTEVKNLVIGKNNAVYNTGILNIGLNILQAKDWIYEDQF